MGIRASRLRLPPRGAPGSPAPPWVCSTPESCLAHPQPGSGLWPLYSERLPADTPAPMVFVGHYLLGGGRRGWGVPRGPDTSLSVALWVTSTCLKKVILISQVDDNKTSNNKQQKWKTYHCVPGH